MSLKVTDYLLYRWRYILGYSLVGLIIVGLLAIAGFFIPGGLTNAEMNSAVTSAQIEFSLQDFDPRSVINLPYNLLQLASFSLLGVTTISIKLPSLLLGALSTLGVLLLLQTWFRRNVAILTTLLIMTTGQFLFIAQNGTASIVYIFWAICLLFAAMMLSRHAKFRTTWKIVFFGAAALSLYTPLSLYILIALASSAALHPHLRFIIRRLSPSKISLAAVAGLALLAPLIYSIVRQPEIGLVLLGIPSEWPSIVANLNQLISEYFNFLSPTTSALMTPVYGLGSMALILLGVFHLFKTSYTARSYVIAIWLVLLTPIIILNPQFSNVTFIPVVLLMAMGINRLLASWYGLFPRNPYARIAGLIPLVILIGGLMISGVNRYVYGYSYSPSITSNFSNDLSLLSHELGQSDQPIVLVVSSDQADFYQAVARHNPNLEVATQAQSTQEGTTTMVSQAAHPALDTTPSEIVTDSSSSAADRFYIYKTN